MGETSYIRSAKIIGLCTLVSRILGMVRDILCAAIFGATMIWDAFLIAFLVPNLFRRLFGEGALTAAFVPVFVEKLEKDGKPAAVGLLNSLLRMMVLVLSSAVVVGIAATFLIPHLTKDPKLILICELLRITLPYLLIICVVAIMGAALNSLNHFVTPAVAPILMNVTWIAALVAFFYGMVPGERNQIQALSWSVLIGGLLGLMIQLAPLRQRGVHLQWSKAEKTLLRQGSGGHVGEVMSLFVPAAFGLAVVQINELVDYVVAELCVPGDGAVSALAYGSHVMQLPLAMIGTAMATAVFPQFSTQAARDNAEEFSRLFQRAMKSCLFIAVPASVGLMVLAPAIIRVLFERRSFDAEATDRAGWVLLFYSSAIWCFCCNHILIRAFYARKDTLTPVKVSAAMVVLNFILNFILVWPLREAGLALASAISGLVNMGVLVVLLRHRIPSISLASVIPAGLKIFAATAAMAVVTWWSFREAAAIQDLSGPSVLAQAARLGIAMGAGILVYFVAAVLLRVKEVRDWLPLGKE